MPADYQILADHNLVQITFSGTMTRGDVLRMRAALVTDDAYRAGFVEFIDMREATEFEFNYNGLLSIIRQYQELFGVYGFPICMVILAPGELGYGMARMFETMSSDDVRFRPILTRTKAEALRELDKVEVSDAGKLALGLLQETGPSA